MIRRWHLVVLALLAAFALACEGAGTAPDSPDDGPTKPSAGLPSSMAALGDSITAGFGSCFAFVACRRNSWSTGTNPDVDSHYRRILAGNPKIKGKARNFAEPGADADALAGQASSAVEMKAQYVTIMIGANDACSWTVAGMTPVQAFRTDIDRGLARLKKGLPKSRVLMVSIPDLYRLWRLGSDNDRAVGAWRKGGVCRSMLADPTSTDESDEERREQVRDRIDAYNEELRKACKAYGKRCRWDGGEAHQLRFTFDMLNGLDYFHPDVEGQAELADALYPSRFGW